MGEDEEEGGRGWRDEAEELDGEEKRKEKQKGEGICDIKRETRTATSTIGNVTSNAPDDPLVEQHQSPPGGQL